MLKENKLTKLQITRLHIKLQLFIWFLINFYNLIYEKKTYEVNTTFMN